MCSKSEVILTQVPSIWIYIQFLEYLRTLHLKFQKETETANRADSGQLQFWSEPSERAIFQNFWRVHCCTKSLFFEIETSYFGSRYVFLSPLKWRGPNWPNLTFWTQKRHISGPGFYLGLYLKYAIMNSKCHLIKQTRQFFFPIYIYQQISFCGICLNQRSKHKHDFSKQSALWYLHLTWNMPFLGSKGQVRSNLNGLEKA